MGSFKGACKGFRGSDGGLSVESRKAEIVTIGFGALEYGTPK